MKKIILVFACASFVVSCKKIQAGSNKGVLKMEEGAERYSDDVKGTYVEAPAANVADSAVAQDSVRTADVKEVQITADSTKTAVK
ncbi:hypothetical protein [Kaistella sp.]|uniref:hypothetical protein n=1 Tax=Kaistella sp. TaxID=2782235 RepID=UPI002F94C458